MSETGRKRATTAWGFDWWLPRRRGPLSGLSLQTSASCPFRPGAGETDPKPFGIRLLGQAGRNTETPLFSLLRRLPLRGWDVGVHTRRSGGSVFPLPPNGLAFF